MLGRSVRVTREGGCNLHSVQPQGGALSVQVTEQKLGARRASGAWDAFVGPAVLGMPPRPRLPRPPPYRRRPTSRPPSSCRRPAPVLLTATPFPLILLTATTPSSSNSPRCRPRASPFVLPNLVLHVAAPPPSSSTSPRCRPRAPSLVLPNLVLVHLSPLPSAPLDSVPAPPSPCVPEMKQQWANG